MKILFIHRQGQGVHLDCSFVHVALRQACKIVGQQNVTLITDMKTLFENESCQVISAQKYLDVIYWFKEVYINLSSNSDWYERMCFERWMIAKQYMMDERIDEVAVLDSDVMIYADPSAILKASAFDFLQYDYGHPHVTIIKNGAVLDKYIELVRSVYSVGAEHPLLKAGYKPGQRGGVSDMSFWIEMQKDKSVKFRSLAKPFELRGYEGKFILDDRVTQVDGFERDELTGLKSIHFDGDFPQIARLDGTRSRTIALHFQRNTKSFMVDYATYLVDDWHRFKLDFPQISTNASLHAGLHLSDAQTNEKWQEFREGAKLLFPWLK